MPAHIHISRRRCRSQHGSQASGYVALASPGACATSIRRTSRIYQLSSASRIRGAAQTNAMVSNNPTTTIVIITIIKPLLQVLITELNDIQLNWSRRRGIGTQL